MFSVRQLVFHSLRYHWRTNIALGLGVAAATAVLVGALIVGDSIRASLRRLTLERLGRIDYVLATDRFFRAELVNELTGSDSFDDHFAMASGALLLPAATVERSSDDSRRAGDVFVIGCDQDFWKFDSSGLELNAPLKGGEIVLNEPLADDLGVQVGDEVTIRFADASQIPADSTLAQKTNRVRSLPRLKVAQVIPARGLGRFQLSANQGTPRNAFMRQEDIQDALGEANRLNAILVASNLAAPDVEQLEQRIEPLQSLLRPSLEDYGLQIAHIRREFEADTAEPQAVFDYFSITSDRMILQPSISDAALETLESMSAQAVLTYLADSIRLEQPADATAPLEVPYSMVTGIDSTQDFPLLPDGEPLADDEIILTSWAAERLQAKPGARIVVEYFEPETAHGEHHLSRQVFRLRTIVPVTEPSAPARRNRPVQFTERPTIFNDPDLTPYVEGITDQESIDNWEAPFPFDIRRMLAEDHEYWRLYRTTPKAYVNLATAQRLWGSRFGEVTSIRIPADQGDAQSIERALLPALRAPATHSDIGFVFQPVKQQGLQASAGTTPFDSLFLGLSFFIILAAVLLVALMFRLGVEQRGNQLGILAAVGIPRKRAVGWLVSEGAIVAALGGLLGVAIGLAYARLMLAGLQSESWWLGAISSPFLDFHASPRSLLIGYASGVLVSLIAIALAARRISRIPPRRLLAGQVASESLALKSPKRTATIIAAALLVTAVGLGVFALRLSGEAQAGAFVGSGALILAALLIWAWQRLRSANGTGRAFSIPRLAMSSAARNPLRSTLTIGLMGSAAFLIVAMSAFRVSPSLEGTGGFRLLARSSAPVFQDLNDPATRADTIGDEAAATIQDVIVYGFRWKAGDDASCRNLYRPTRPQVLGVSSAWIRHFESPSQPAFHWADMAAKEGTGEHQNPWRLLERDKEDDAIPVVIDKNTAAYSLHWSGIGSVYSVEYENGRTVKFRIVGLLSNSVLQGMLLIHEDHFRRAFPEVSGYRYFMLGGPPAQIDRAQDLFENALGDQGFDAVDARRVLSDLLAVQNTYLSTFQSLGALGLLLGTFGLATVQARSVLERRGEFAVLRAQGFRRRRVLWLVLCENLVLLIGGLLAGAIAALCAILPHIVVAEANLPVLSVLGLLLAVLVVGTISAAIAMQLTLRGSLLEALRGE